MKTRKLVNYQMIIGALAVLGYDLVLKLLPPPPADSSPQILCFMLMIWVIGTVSSYAGTATLAALTGWLGAALLHARLPMDTPLLFIFGMIPPVVLGLLAYGFVKQELYEPDRPRPEFRVYVRVFSYLCGETALVALVIHYCAPVIRVLVQPIAKAAGVAL